MATRYWWVNQNKTFRQEQEGGYMWSPKKKANGHRNPFYDFMRVVAPGDVILSFAGARIKAFGIALSPCYESPKPPEFGRAGEDWSSIGWRVDVAYKTLSAQIRPADHMASIRRLLPQTYAPLTQSGQGLQGVYLTQIPHSLMAQLALLIGEEMIAVLDNQPSVARDAAKEDNPIQERWERRIVSEIRSMATLPETEREQIIDARVGQGRFRSLVYAHERCCRVTKVDRPEHLIASHIRPWRHSSNEQRLDPENGLMLTPNVYHLFDRGFITFSDSGKLFCAESADAGSLIKMGIDPRVETRVGDFSLKQRQYMEFHRDELFLSNAKL